MRRLLPLLLLAACTTSPPPEAARFRPSPGEQPELAELYRLRPLPYDDVALEDARRQPRLLDAARAIATESVKPCSDAMLAVREFHSSHRSGLLSNDVHVVKRCSFSASDRGSS